MDDGMDDLHEAEIQDALGACDELFNVISRLKRLGLLTEEEDRETKERVDDITRTLMEKLPPGEHL